MVWRFIVYENVRRIVFWRAIACEFIATAMLIFIGCGSIILQLNPTAPISASTTIRISLAFGFALNILIKIFGPVSGCHVNPAVSIAFMSIGKVSLVRAACYSVAQIAGSVAGTALLYAIIPAPFHNRLGETTLHNNLTPAQGFGTEAILTFILVMAISSCLDEKRIDHFKMKITNPLTIGFTISALHLVGIPFTGASMNPARSFGPAVINMQWNHHWVYWVGPIVGGCIGAIVYHYLVSPAFVQRLREQTREAVNNHADSKGGYYSSSRPSRPTFDRSLSVLSSSSQVVDVPVESYNLAAIIEHSESADKQPEDDNNPFSKF